MSSNYPLWEERRGNTTLFRGWQPVGQKEGPWRLRVIGSLDSPDGLTRLFGRDFPLLESANINTKNIQKHSFSDIPSWCTTKPTILFDLHNSKKSLSDSHLMKQNFQELQLRLSDYQHIYTDGSKVEDKVGCVYISGSHHEKGRLSDGSSIFTAESKAIDMALDYVMNISLDNKFVIFSDSLSVLKSLNHTSSKNSKIQNHVAVFFDLEKAYDTTWRY